MIDIVNLSKSYPACSKALDGISLKVEDGSIVGVIGANGSGKTTLFKIICGLITDYEGKCDVFGEKSDITKMPQISYLSEVRGLDTRGYVLEHLTDLLMYKGYSHHFSKESIRYWLKEFNMEECRYQKIGLLSKGNQQKLQVILSIANNPRLLILDEPFSGLDINTVDFLMDILFRVNQQGCTILFSSHDLYNNFSYCTQFLILNKGRICEKGTLNEIQQGRPMILEIKNNTIKAEDLQRIAGKENVSKINDEYYIRIKNENMAKDIFNTLEDKFSEKFYLRKIGRAHV